MTKKTLKLSAFGFLASMFLLAGANVSMAGDVVPVVNGIKDADSVIRFRPPNCGPNGYVINVPKYGEMCAQKGSWTVAADAKAMARGHVEAGAPCGGKDDHAIGEKGELLSCNSDDAKWRMADQNDCQMNAAAIIDGAKAQYADKKDAVLTVSVLKNLCVETARFANFTLGDTHTWKVEVVARNEKRQALAYKITPMANNSMTSLILSDKDGHTYSLMLKSAK